MITINIKTPRDYYNEFLEWVKQPRKKNAKEYVDFLEGVLVSKISESFNDYVPSEATSTQRLKEDLEEMACKCIYEVSRQTKDLIDKTARPL